MELYTAADRKPMTTRINVALDWLRISMNGMVHPPLQQTHAPTPPGKRGSGFSLLVFFVPTPHPLLICVIHTFASSFCSFVLIVTPKFVHFVVLQSHNIFFFATYISPPHSCFSGVKTHNRFSVYLLFTRGDWFPCLQGEQLTTNKKK